MILEVKNLTVWYGSVRALSRVSFSVDEGESVALLGPNGAGKTTVLRAIVGILKDYGGRIEEGEILFNGKSIRGTPPYELVKMGIGFVPQGRRVFPSMTVKENLEMGGYLIENLSELKRNLKVVFELFPILEERQNQKARTLSGGEQQMLSIARALMMNPELLLLDEPLLGLSPNYIREVMEKVRSIQQKGVSIVVVEHNIKTVLKYVDRAYLLAIGEIVLEDNPEAFVNNEILKDIFL